MSYLYTSMLHNKIMHTNNKSSSLITWRYFGTHYVPYMIVPTFRAGSQDNTSLLSLCSRLNEAFSHLVPVRFAFSGNNRLAGEGAVGFAGCAHTNRAFVLFKDEYWWSWWLGQLDGTANKKQWPGCHKEDRIWIRTEDLRLLLRCYSLHGQKDGCPTSQSLLFCQHQVGTEDSGNKW